MSETMHPLENIGEFELVQRDWLTDIQYHSSIHCTSESVPIEMDIYFGDNSSEVGETPYYALRWPTQLKGDDVVIIFREVGERFGAIEYVSQGIHNQTSTPVSYCGKLTPEQKKAMDEARGISDNLDKVLCPDFDVLRVITEDFTLFWDSERFLQSIYIQNTHKEPRFALTHDSQLDNGLVEELVARTLSPEHKDLGKQALKNLNAVFEEYAFAMPVNS